MGKDDVGKIKEVLLFMKRAYTEEKKCQAALRPVSGEVSLHKKGFPISVFEEYSTLSRFLGF